MSKKLFVIESSGKIEKLKKILGTDYIIIASLGHIKDLPDESLGISIHHQDNKTIFIPKYILSIKGKSVLSYIKKLKNNFSEIYLATDMDREGEMIALELFEEIQKFKDCSFKRIRFDSIVKETIINSIQNPSTLNYSLINAQKARRLLDRFVGYMISPVLPKGLSAGRVQSPAVKIIFDQDKLIKEERNLDNLHKTKRFTINGLFYETSNNKYILKNPEIIDVNEQTITTELDYLLSLKDYYVNSIENNSKKVDPPLPFKTSALQINASKILNMKPSVTMINATNLYQKGYITYIRTDSIVMSNTFINKLKPFISSLYGDEYFKYRKLVNQNTLSQEAHECIRPTELITPDCCNDLSKYELRLYTLIFWHTISCLMIPAEYNEVDTIILSNDIKFSPRYFIGKELFLVEEGYLKAYNNITKKENNNIEISLQVENKLNIKQINFTECCELQHYHYSESSFIKKLEDLGIGRPSTFVSILDNILKKGYIKSKCNISGVDINITSAIGRVMQKSNNIKILNKITTIGCEKDKLTITDFGKTLIDELNNCAPFILDYSFTKLMEADLDNIAQATENSSVFYQEMLNNMYELIHKHIGCKQQVKTFNKICIENNNDDKKDNSIFTINDTDGNIYKLIYSAKLNKHLLIKEWIHIKYKDLSSVVSFYDYPSELIDKNTNIDELKSICEQSTVIGLFKNVPIYVNWSDKSNSYYLKYKKMYKTLPTNKITLENAIKILNSFNK